MKNKQIALIAIMVWVLGGLLTAGPTHVSHAPQTLKTLEAKFQWAMDTSSKQAGKSGFYIAYCFTPMSKGEVWFNRYSISEQGKSFNEIIYGKKIDSNTDEKKADRDFVVLFRFGSNPKSMFTIKELKLGNMDRWIKLKDLPIYWLGKIDNQESIVLLPEYFKKCSDSEIKEDIVTAVGVHGCMPQVFGFLKKVINGDYNSDIREQAVFWMAKQQSKEALDVIVKVINSDPDEDVREHAVFGLSLIKMKKADDELIRIAKKGKDKEIRQKALFWLGQKAVKRSAEVLGDVAENDEDSDIQSAAVFGLSQLPNGVERLIKIARTHRSLKVRKKAIFWLSQSEDPRALNTILAILNDK